MCSQQQAGRQGSCVVCISRKCVLFIAFAVAQCTDTAALSASEANQIIIT